MGKEPSAMDLCIPCILHNQGKGVHGSVRDLNRSEDVRMKVGLQMKGLIPREKGGWDLSIATGLEKTVLEIDPVFWKGNEEALRLLDAMGGDPFQDTIFSDALPGRHGVGDGVSASAVEEPMIPSGSARGEISFFDQSG